MRRVRLLIAWLWIALALAPLGGCAASWPALNNTRWKLTEWTLSSLNPADFTITAEFADGRISGKSGVNSYSGTCKIGPGRAFSVAQVAGTQMAGPEPAMRAESAYLTLLGQARAYGVTGARLTFFDEGGNVSLVFEAMSAEGEGGHA